MTTLTRVRTEAKLAEEKKAHEKRRNIVMLFHTYLSGIGYLDTAESLVRESSINVQQYELADNLSIEVILEDFENYFEIRYGKRPKISKRTEIREDSAEVKKKATKLPPPQNSINISSIPETASPELPLSICGSALSAARNIQSSVTASSDSQSGDCRCMADISGYLSRFSNDLEYQQLCHTVMRDVVIQRPNVTFDDIIGHNEVKRIIHENFQLSNTTSDAVKQRFQHILTFPPWKGLLLFGPPGTGKTQFVKALANSYMKDTLFFLVSPSTIASKFRGESERTIRALFEIARYCQPSVVFFDEFDGIFTKRGDDDHEASRRLKAEILNQFDQTLVNSSDNMRLYLICSSNLPWDIDGAILRRLEKRVYFPLPTEAERLEMMRNKLISVMSAQSLSVLQIAAERTLNYSGCDVDNLIKEACLCRIRRGSISNGGMNIEERDVLEALDKVKSSLAINQDRFVSFANNFSTI